MFVENKLYLYNIKQIVQIVDDDSFCLIGENMKNIKVNINLCKRLIINF